MRLIRRRSQRAEERFESWVAQLHQRSVQEGTQTASGPCLDEAFLRELARKSSRIELSDERISHAASCPRCMSRLLAIRQELRSKRRKAALALAAVSCLVIAIIVFSVSLKRSNVRPSNTAETVTTETVDLSDLPTLRGQQPKPLRSVSLPAAVVRVTVILPRFSEPGLYLVAVSHDQAGGEVLAADRGVSTKRDKHDEISVEFDLRNATAGSYFLSTTHEQDQASYYYPLQIR